MVWNLLSLLVFFVGIGILALAYALRMAGVDDGSPMITPVSAVPLDRAFREEPVQTFMWQVQAARYWQPPFRRR